MEKFLNILKYNEDRAVYSDKEKAFKYIMAEPWRKRERAAQRKKDLTAWKSKIITS